MSTLLSIHHANAVTAERLAAPRNRRRAWKAGR